MSRADMERVRDQYVAAARMGIECGFDMLELHMAHAYTLSSFLSLRNRRPDEYGRSLENRMRAMTETIRAVRAERSRQRMMAQVPQATVVVTNPTHYAVALRYDQSSMRAPKLVAKGADLIAGNIRRVGAEAGVPTPANSAAWALLAPHAAGRRGT